MLELDGQTLSLEEVARVARGGEAVGLAAAALATASSLFRATRRGLILGLKSGAATA
mgnify:CR=1 FL=1